MSYALLMLLRPVLNRQSATDEERACAWEIVRAHGRTSLARYTLLSDKKLFFTSGGSLISYVTENRIALTLGDPIGPAETISTDIAEFRSLCSSNDWLPAFYQASPSYVDTYKSEGFDILTLGQEAIVDLSVFTLDGSENKTLRNSYNKMIRFGYHYDVVQPPYSARMLRELNTCPILLARDREGFIEVFANIVTEFQVQEVAVDLMRHRGHVESGLMDFLFVSLLQWAKENGYATFNLGLSALSGVGEHSDDPAIERALNYIYRNVSRLYNFRGLHSFKEKFHPTWSPRYLVYPGPSNLPAISISVLNANLGGSPLGNFIRRNK